MMKKILNDGGYMETVRNLETKIAKLYEDAPHLPLELRRWLGVNAWWLVLVGVIVSVLAIVPLLGALALLFGLSGAPIGAAGMYGGAVSGGIIGVAVFASLIALLGLVVTVAVMGLAVSPLKVRAKKGWTLLFIVLLINTALGIVGALISINVGGIIWTLVWAAIEAYVLFEIRGEFGPKVVKAKAPDVAPLKKSETAESAKK